MDDATISWIVLTGLALTISSAIYLISRTVRLRRMLYALLPKERIRTAFKEQQVLCQVYNPDVKARTVQAGGGRRSPVSTPKEVKTISNGELLDLNKSLRGEAETSAWQQVPGQGSVNVQTPLESDKQDEKKVALVP